MVEAGADVILIYDDYGTTGAPLTSVEDVEGVHLPASEEAHRGHPRRRRPGHAPLVRLSDALPRATTSRRSSTSCRACSRRREMTSQRPTSRLGDRLTFCTGVDVQQGESMTAGTSSATTSCAPTGSVAETAATSSATPTCSSTPCRLRTSQRCSRPCATSRRDATTTESGR